MTGEAIPSNPFSVAFYPSSATVTISASDTSSHVETGGAGNCVRIENQSTEWVGVSWATGVAVADSSSINIAPGAVEVLGIPVTIESFAAIMPAGKTGTIRFTKGWGI